MKSDIEISQTTPLKNIEVIAKQAGLLPEEITAYGKHKAKVHLSTLARLNHRPDGKLIAVTAITPTPLGEGKTVTTIGLVQGLKKLGASCFACIRQPSMGPIFGVKGGAAGGGYSQVVPMEEMNLHLTGDIHALTSAHNLAAAALDARLYHEDRLGQSEFEKKTGQKALNIDPNQILWRRVMDHNDRALRTITVSLSAQDEPSNGVIRTEHFDITAASELMAILALSHNLPDMRKRLGRLLLAYDTKGAPITAEDLEVAGAMAVILKDTIEPTLMQTLEGVPTLVHSGPFANIAHGNSSIIADNIALKLSDYVVTEGGFGSDMGFEKACNIKAREAQKNPDCAVVVATLRALKSHSKTPPSDCTLPNLAALQSGICNLEWHIRNTQKYGIPVVVAINRFPQDHDDELFALIHQIEATFSTVQVVISEAFSQGGIGTEKLAKAVMTACEQPTNFAPLYPLEMPLIEKFLTVAEVGYGANNVKFSAQAKQQITQLETEGYGHLPVCLAKTPLSISHDPQKKGVPSAFTLPINSVKVCAGAGFVYALCGKVFTMPGLSDNPAYRHLDIDENGQIIGLS
jgi:formate--tetrahydrofolate ligase